MEPKRVKRKFAVIPATDVEGCLREIHEMGYTQICRRGAAPSTFGTCAS